MICDQVHVYYYDFLHSVMYSLALLSQLVFLLIFMIQILSYLALTIHSKSTVQSPWFAVVSLGLTIISGPTFEEPPESIIETHSKKYNYLNLRDLNLSSDYRYYPSFIQFEQHLNKKPCPRMFSLATRISCLQNCMQ